MARASLSERHLQTNPIWSLREFVRLLWQRVPHDLSWNDAMQRLANIVQALAEQSIAIPHGPLSKFKSERLLPEDFEVPQCATEPGVIGVVVDEFNGEGFVVPLTVEKSNAWSVSPLLPFSSVDIQDALMQLLTSTAVSLDGVLPERFNFDVKEQLGENAEGSSMTIAGLLAVLSAVQATTPKLLSCVCSTVQPDSSGQLQSVDAATIPIKINAFLREYGRGSLLVRHPDCSESAQFDDDFQHVLQVRSFGDLAGYLENEGLLTPLLERVDLSRHDLIKVLERLRSLEEDKHDYHAALHLATRIESCTIREDVPAWEKNRHKSRIANIYRHLGRFEDAFQMSKAIVVSLDEAEDATSHDEIAKATASFAASLFDGHAFARICDELGPWCTKINKDARCLHPDTRIHILNTLARAQAVLGIPQWEDNVRYSLSLQQRCDLSNVARSRNFLILGLLRDDRPEEASKEIACSEATENMDDMSRWMRGFATAECHRVQGRAWSDDDMESEAQLVSTPGHALSKSPGHPFAFYFQATARQSGRADAAQRFRRAAEFFQKDVSGDSENTILGFYSTVMHLAESAASGNSELWRHARARIRDYLSNPQASNIRQHYDESFSALGESPDYEAMERLLQRLPLI